MYRPPQGKWVPRTGSFVVAAVVLLAVLYFVGPGLGPATDIGPGDGYWSGAESESLELGSARSGVSGPSVDAAAVEVRALALMREGIAVIAAARAELDELVDARVDPNATGLIGLELSVTTTTLGDLAAKRTATHPAWAAVIAGWMLEAGVGAGDPVWATFSGSFPGLNLAVLAAAEAVGADLIAISSLGASMWGANVPEFPWSDMEVAVRDAGLFEGGSIALTLGGSADRGPRLLGDGTPPLRAAATRSGWPLLEPQDLTDAVALRLETFAKASDGREPALFVNVGGGHASMGDCPNASTWPSGLSRVAFHCGGSVPGLLYSMAENEVPIIHLLNIKELALAVGIPIDARF